MADSFFIGIKVKANSGFNAIAGYTTIGGKDYLNLRIKAQALEGKANKAIIKFLAKEWHITASNIEIKSGVSSNIKIIFIKNIDVAYLKSLLNNYIYSSKN